MKKPAGHLFRITAVIVGLFLASVVLAGESALEDGLNAFRGSDFESAIEYFQEALLESPDTNTEATAYFWLAKSAMAEGRLENAERNFEYYLQNFPEHRFIPEARYQRGRILFLQDDFESAIQLLERFMQIHPDSPFVANAVYWSGEALFNLGRLEEARRLFQRVLRDFPTSFRVEAARYRVAVIDLTFREQELLQLLRWSHEEYLRAVEEFQQRESMYQEALSSYRRRLEDAAEGEFREEIVRLNTEVRTLQESLRSRDARIRRLEDQIDSMQSDSSR